MRASRLLFAGGALLVMLTAAGPKKDEAPPPEPVQTQQFLSAIDNGLTGQLKTLIERAKLAKQDYPVTAYALAELYLGTGQNDAALAAFRNISGGENWLMARAAQGEGIAAYRLHRAADAVRALQRAVDLDPALQRAWAALGAAADLQRDFALAERAYGEALARNPNDAAALSNRGYSRILQRREDDAIVDLTRAVSLAPANVTTRNNLRIALALNGRYDEAMAGIDPREIHVHLNNIGYAAMLRGDYDTAESYFNQALDKSDAFYAPAFANLKTLEQLRRNQKPAQAPAGSQ